MKKMLLFTVVALMTNFASAETEVKPIKRAECSKTSKLSYLIEAGERGEVSKFVSRNKDLDYNSAYYAYYVLQVDNVSTFITKANDKKYVLEVTETGRNKGTLSIFEFENPDVALESNIPCVITK